jgi:mRNA interferase MazF
VERGEVWWAIIDERRPVVLLSGNDGEFRAMQIVPPATAAQKQGFLVLSGEEASDPDRLRQMTNAVGSDIRAVGIEVGFGRQEGLEQDGVVRVALPLDGLIFCTWLVTLTPECLTERVGALSPAKLHHLTTALHLAGLE